MEVLCADRDLRDLLYSRLRLLVRSEAGPIYRCRGHGVAVVAGFLSPVISGFAATVNRWRKP
jgi:hypothetical protein